MRLLIRQIWCVPLPYRTKTPPAALTSRLASLLYAIGFTWDRRRLHSVANVCELLFVFVFVIFNGSDWFD